MESPRMPYSLDFFFNTCIGNIFIVTFSGSIIDGSIAGKYFIHFLCAITLLLYCWSIFSKPTSFTVIAYRSLFNIECETIRYYM